MHAVQEIDRSDPNELILSASLLTELALTSYFATSFVYYLNFLPLGHLINVAYTFIFAGLAVLQRPSRAFPAYYLGHIFLISSVAIVSVLSWLMRDSWLLADLIRSFTWLAPAALLFLLAGARNINFARIGLSVASISVVINILVTVGFATFDRELGKFIVVASWTWISSNELSFHLMVFGAMFFSLSKNATARACGWLVAIGSLFHLSKAHLLAAFVGAFAAVSGRRAWLIMLLIGVVATAFWWAAQAGLLQAISVPAEYARVFGPFVEALSVFYDSLVAGHLVELGALADAVGLYRFDVYLSAFDLIRNSPFGSVAGVVASGLRGLDPHSNLLYLALREGWFVTSFYIATSLYIISQVRTRDIGGKAVFAILVYTFIRGIFVTFDPVKLLCLGIFCSIAVSDSYQLRSEPRSATR